MARPSYHVHTGGYACTGRGRLRMAPVRSGSCVAPGATRAKHGAAGRGSAPGIGSGALGLDSGCRWLAALVTTEDYAGRTPWWRGERVRRPPGMTHLVALQDAHGPGTHPQ